MRLAITGTIGSGKSTVADYIRSKGYDVFDADKVNAELLNKGNLGYIEVQKAFPEVFDNDELNKAKLAQIVFENENLRLKLESIMHPLIRDVMVEQSLGKELFIAEIPLLFEKNWDIYFDSTLLIYTNSYTTIKRLEKRGLLESEALLRIKNQMPIDDKLRRADEIIYNNGSLNDLYTKVDKWLNKYAR